MMMNACKTFSVTALLVMVSACAGTQSSGPVVSHDGLTLLPDTKFGEVYGKTGVDLSEYTEFGVAPCNVSFRKNWLRDQNSSRLDLSHRVTQQDVDKIKDNLGDSCTQKFTEALQKDPAYNLVDAFDDGEHVLVLRPSIINLDISAPDVMSASRSRSYTTSAGEMTLSLEVVDATTDEVLYRIVDRKRGMDTGRIQWTTSASNSADANRALNRWAGQLRDGLDTVRGM
jgi:hypothetical protein